MNTVDAVNLALNQLRQQLVRLRAGVSPNAVSRAALRLRVQRMETVIETLEALRDLLKVSTELGTADAAAIRQSMKEDLVR